LLTAGVPCQPASLAGKRRGAKDDRWLWPEAIRVIGEARPRWALLENPVGIRTMGLDRIITELEAMGYTVGTVDIPACAVNSPQLRHRIWIVAHANEGRPQDRRVESRTAIRQRYEDTDEQSETKEPDQGSPVAHGSGVGQQGSGECEYALHTTSHCAGEASKPDDDAGDVADSSVLGRNRGERTTDKDGTEVDNCSFWSDYEWVEAAGKWRRCPESRICWVVDGVPYGLSSPIHHTSGGLEDGTQGGQGNPEEVSILRHDVQAQAIQWEAGRPLSIQEKEVLFPIMCKLEPECDRVHGQVSPTQEEPMPRLRHNQQSGGSSSGWRQIEQYRIELDDALRLLPHDKTLAAMARDGDTARRDKCGIVSIIQGLSYGLPARIRRPALEALGNSIVPEVAARIIWAIRMTEEG